MSWRVALRALLTSTALVILAFPSLIIAGAFLPHAAAVSRLGALLDVGLAWILVAVVVATGMVGVAVWLGGRRFTLLLLLPALVVTSGTGIVAYRYWSFAQANGAYFDNARGLAERPSDPPADATFTYPTSDPAISLHAELWRSPAGARNPGSHPRAAVVYVHGGAFVGGGLHMRPQLFAALAAAGYPVLDIEYRLAPPPRWVDAPGDVLCGLAFLRTIADDEGIDPNRVVVMGDSAGGSLALLATYAAGTDMLASSCAGDPIVPAAVVGIAPAADLAGIWQDNTISGAGLRFPEAYIGGSPAAFPDRYAAASPFRMIRAGLPPTLLIAGENDHLVLHPRVTAIADALRAASDDVRLLIVPFAEHGFDGLPNGFGAQTELSIVSAFVAEVAG